MTQMIKNTMAIQEQIIEIIKRSNGISAKEIAEKLNVDRATINHYLYSDLKGTCLQDSSYRWYIRGRESISTTQVAKIDKTLSNLCHYYLDCISFEGGTNVSVFTQDQNPEYCELTSIKKEDFSNDTLTFIANASTKEKCMWIGYPITIIPIYSTKNNRYYYKVAPVFLFSLEYNNGNITIDSIPSINSEIARSYISKDINEQTQGLIQLEAELGLNNNDIDIEIDELVMRLQNIRQWKYKEGLSATDIRISPHIAELTEDGIYNRAVIILSDTSPYTKGLSEELSKLAELPESAYKDTALYHWIHRTIPNVENLNSQDDYLLEVLPLNTEQRQAILNSLRQSLTIVTGPPGTGKSQVVTDLVINLAWRNSNAIFSSKNNKAVEVVEQRVNAIGRRPILLPLRGGANMQVYTKFLEDLLNMPMATSASRQEYEEEKEIYNGFIVKYKQLKKEKADSINFRNQIDQQEKAICEVRDKWGDLIGKITENEINFLKKILHDYEIAYYRALKEKQSIWTKIIWWAIHSTREQEENSSRAKLNDAIVKYHIEPIIHFEDESIFENHRNRINDGISKLKKLYDYSCSLLQLNKNRSVTQIDKDLYVIQRQMADSAERVWKKWLICNTPTINSTLRQSILGFISEVRLSDGNINTDLQRKFIRLQRDLRDLLPICGVTSLSTRGRIPFCAGMYDLLIIDEASQCDIASILPLLFRAKRAVIIGDPQQLQHITSISNKQDLTLLEKYNINKAWSYKINSLYNIACSLCEPENIIELRDHHRCHGDIIGFSNRAFYNETLRIATNYQHLRVPNEHKAGIRWIDIIGHTIRPKQGGAYNKEEALQIIAELKRLVDCQYRGTIGVVTPFRAQADYINELIVQDQNFANILLTSYEFMADTVHKFQGDERDIIIFSPVVSQNVQRGAIAFLQETGNLFNVAITRARAMLIVVGDSNYCADCEIKYMKDFVSYVRNLQYKQNNKSITSPSALSRNYPILNIDVPISDWEKLFYSALYDAGIKTIPQYAIDKYHLDLALVYKNHYLDIEIDGERYHRSWNGELSYKDSLRNQRLYELGWDVMRFWVYQVRDELQWCIEQVRKWQLYIDNKELM